METYSAEQFFFTNLMPSLVQDSLDESDYSHMENEYKIFTKGKI
jgi:hypothetical protein